MQTSMKVVVLLKANYVKYMIFIPFVSIFFKILRALHPNAVS